MAQKVPAGPLSLPCLPKVTYSKGSGPHMPVTPDRESQPQAVTGGSFRTARDCVQRGSDRPGAVPCQRRAGLLSEACNGLFSACKCLSVSLRVTIQQGAT